jgi:hypothetical protein
LSFGCPEPLRNFLHAFVREERRGRLARLRAAEGRVRSKDDVVLHTELAKRNERETRVQLDLVRRRDDLRLGEERGEKRDAEIGHADCADFARIEEFFHFGPGLEDGRALVGRENTAVDGGLRPVHEEEVDVVDVERGERGVERLADAVVGGVVPVDMYKLDK